MGLRYDEALADKLLEGVRAMEDSVTYQAIIRKGEAKGGTRVTFGDFGTTLPLVRDRS